MTPKTEYDDEKTPLEVSAHPVAETLRRVDDLWFEEDTLILRAQDDIFRVSKGVLMARSEVLKTMIGGLGQPSVAKLFFLPPPAKASFAVVIGVLRLAHEYDVQYLLRRALLHFEGFFPSTLDGDRVYPETISESGVDMLSASLIALRVVLDVGALWNAPSIIYECCTFSLAEILDDPHRRELPAANERALLLSHQKLAALGASFVTRFLYAEPSGRCRSAAKCNLGKLVWLGKVDAWRKEGRDSVPLEFWDEGDWEGMEGDFCQGCVGSFQESYAEGRKMLWGALPATFGLPGWDELNKAKVEMFAGSEER
ncbi:hypothetical protein C8R46DRAFT_1342377 [Mycena filopes]|nr:hypothetical protein C8R46DRAFT_1342377 [Mycena filopes]